MKKIGIVGGRGPEATVDYYKRITRFFHEQGSGLNTPEILIYSANIVELFELLADKRDTPVVDWLVAKLITLKSAGADFAAISANTPHIVFDEVAARSPLPLISIVEATRLAAQKLNIRRAGLLGTKFTMQADFFANSFLPHGISVAVPGSADQEYIHQKLVTEIELGFISEGTRQGLVDIVNRMIQRDGIETVILGCTELPLILREEDICIPLLNTTEIHVSAICDACQRP